MIEISKKISCEFLLIVLFFYLWMIAEDAANDAECLEVPVFCCVLTILRNRQSLL